MFVMNTVFLRDKIFGIVFFIDKIFLRSCLLKTRRNTEGGNLIRETNALTMAQR